MYTEELKDIIEFKLLTPEGIIGLFDKSFDVKEWLLQKKEDFLISPDQNKSIFNDLKSFFMLALTGLAIVIVMLALSIFGLRKWIKPRLVALYQSTIWNGVIKSLSISYIKSAMTCGSQILLFIKGS